MVLSAEDAKLSRVEVLCESTVKKRFLLNVHTTGFHPQTQKLEPAATNSITHYGNKVKTNYASATNLNTTYKREYGSD